MSLKHNSELEPHCFCWWDMCLFLYFGGTPTKKLDTKNENITEKKEVL